MNWKRLKFWRVNTEAVDTQQLYDAINRLQQISLIKDEHLLNKTLELEKLRREFYTILGAIAFAHGGAYILRHEFISAISDENFASKLNVENDEAGIKIAVIQESQGV